MDQSVKRRGECTVIWDPSVTLDPENSNGAFSAGNSGVLTWASLADQVTDIIRSRSFWRTDVILEALTARNQYILPGNELELSSVRGQNASITVNSMSLISSNCSVIIYRWMQLRTILKCDFNNSFGSVRKTESCWRTKLVSPKIVWWTIAIWCRGVFNV